MPTPRQLAVAFSSHLFGTTLAHLADDVRWVQAGGSTLTGRDAVVAACEETSAALARTTTEFLRFMVIADGDTVAVDAVGRYRDADGATSVVSSCDIYEFRDDRLAAITSYAVELDPEKLADAYIHAAEAPSE